MTDDPRHRPGLPWPGPPGSADRPAPQGAQPTGSALLILEQDFDGDSLYALRAAVSAHAGQAGLPPGRVGDLVVAVNELATNAIRHGAGHGKLHVWQQGRMLQAQVSDNGAPQGEGSPARDAASWPIEPDHGLAVAHQLADRLSLRSGPDGSVTTVSFTLGPSGRHLPFRLIQHIERGCTLLAVTGALDLASAHRLTGAVDQLTAAVPDLRLVLDLADVTAWDSSGLAALLTTQQHITARPPARMILSTTPSGLLHKLTDTGLANPFTLADTIDDAIDELSQPG
jgi:anti-anti-sigma factor